MTKMAVALKKGVLRLACPDKLGVKVWVVGVSCRLPLADFVGKSNASWGIVLASGICVP